MAASEAAPLAKTGGLADVVGALPKALTELGHEVAVVLPRYGSISLEGAWPAAEKLRVQLGANGFVYDLWEKRVNGTRFFFMECPVLFDRPGLYNSGGRDYSDNHLRFAAFCHGVLSVLRHLFNADLLHLHDWQTALCAAYFRTRLALDPMIGRTKTVYTIHNLDYQGRFSSAEFAELGLDSWLLKPAFLEYFGDVTFMKAGIVFSDAVTTVSPRYAREIQTPEFGSGLDGVLRAHSGKLTGILNGCDYSEWDPRNDPYIARKYDATHLDGKRDCKLDLLLELGLDQEHLDRPLIGMVTRLAQQKGIDLFIEIADALFANDDVALAVLGSGDPAYEEFFRQLAVRYPGRVAGHIGYNNKLAHQIEAGADVFLMPSRFEPCGLNQMYSLRYGTVPIVRATGGLDDTVTGDTGFKFFAYAPVDLLLAIRAALYEWKNDPAAWQMRVKRGMEQDFSWRASAAAYSGLYGRLLG